MATALIHPGYDAYARSEHVELTPAALTTTEITTTTMTTLTPLFLLHKEGFPGHERRNLF